MGLRSLTGGRLAEQLATTMFFVTAFHEFSGESVEYLTDPMCAATQLREHGADGKLERQASVAAWMVGGATGTLTALRNPPLMGNWSHVLVGGEHDAATRQALINWHHGYKKALLREGARNLRRNAARARPFYLYNPLSHEAAINI